MKPKRAGTGLEVRADSQSAAERRADRAPLTGETGESPGPIRGDVGGEAAELFRQARDLIDKNRFPAAVPLLQKALTLAPGSPSVRRYLGYVLWKGNQRSEATREFERARQLDPQDAYTLYFLGRIAQSEGKLREAIERYESEIILGTPVYDTYHHLGQAYFDVGNLAKARAMIERAIETTPWDGSLHYQLGKINQRSGRQREAQQEFEASERLKRIDRTSVQKLLELSEAIRNQRSDRVFDLRDELLSQTPGDPDTLDSLGMLLGRAGFYADALEPLNRAAKLDPESYEAQCNLGLTLARLGRNNDAEAPLLRALELRPDSFETNSALAVIYVSQNRNRDALERLRNARNARPQDVKVLALLGEQYFQGRYYDDAVRTFPEALRLKPKDSALRYLLIQAYERSQQYAQALREAQVALKLFPSDARAHFEVGQQLANLGHYQEARPYFEEAARLDPSFTEAYNLLANVQFLHGEYEVALATFEKARALDSRNLFALRGIGQSLIHLKRLEEARAELETAVTVHPEDAELYFELSQVYARLDDQTKASEAAATFRRLRAEETQRQVTAHRKFEPGISTSDNREGIPP